MLDLLKKSISVARALLTGKDVSPERLEKRLEVCSSCDMMVKDGALMRCGVCGCKVAENGLVNLARYEETGSYGCKHPDGSKWKEAGV